MKTSTRITDYRLKGCMVGQKSKNNISGSCCMVDAHLPKEQAGQIYRGSIGEPPKSEDFF
jgi:hypothetical protein